MENVKAKRVERIGDATLYLGDCLEILPTLGEVDAVVTDPPYGKVKGDFDHQWTNRPAMLESVDAWLDKIVPRIAFNGSLWWFAWPSLAGRIEAKIAERMNPIAHVVWKKPSTVGNKIRRESLRAPMPVTERILFAEHYNVENMAKGESTYAAKCDEIRGFVFAPLRDYFISERNAAGLTTANIVDALGSTTPSHYFSTSQWALPTKEHYEAMRELFNKEREYKHLRREYKHLRREYKHLRREYKHLRREYEDLRREYEDLRRYFNCEKGDQFTDVWEFPSCNEAHEHPTRKPAVLMNYIIKLSVRESATALDPFMGSGTTGVACANLGRKFIGIELEEKYFDIACERIAAAYAQGRLF